MHRPSPTYAIATTWTVQHKRNFLQVGTKYTYSQRYTYMQECPAAIQTPAQWNLIDRSMSAPAVCVITQQYSSATFISLRFHARK
jgi:hypothetical protein